MNALLNHPLSCAYKIGRETTLPPSWGAKNLKISDSRIYYILDGEIEVDFDDENVIAKQGDLLLIPAKQNHSCFMTNKKFARKYWCHFELKTENRDFFDNYLLPHKIQVGFDRYLISIFHKLFRSNENPTPINDLMASSAIIELVAYYMSHCKIIKQTQFQDEINHATNYIKRNYFEQITLDQLSADAHLSPNYFIKKFKERTGMTPIKYLNAFRIEMAKSKLLNSNDPINNILEEVGFLDQAYFSKLFKKTTGYSPRAFREMYDSAHESLPDN